MSATSWSEPLPPTSSMNSWRRISSSGSVPHDHSTIAAQALGLGHVGERAVEVGLPAVVGVADRVAQQRGAARQVVGHERRRAAERSRDGADRDGLAAARSHHRERRSGDLVQALSHVHVDRHAGQCTDVMQRCCATLLYALLCPPSGRSGASETRDARGLQMRGTSGFAVAGCAAAAIFLSACGSSKRQQRRGRAGDAPARIELVDQLPPGRGQVELVRWALPAGEPTTLDPHAGGRDVGGDGRRQPLRAPARRCSPTSPSAPGWRREPTGPTRERS